MLYVCACVELFCWLSITSRTRYRSNATQRTNRTKLRARACRTTPTGSRTGAFDYLSFDRTKSKRSLNCLNFPSIQSTTRTARTRRSRRRRSTRARWHRAATTTSRRRRRATLRMWATRRVSAEIIVAYYVFVLYPSTTIDAKHICLYKTDRRSRAAAGTQTIRPSRRRRRRRAVTTTRAIDRSRLIRV